MKVSKQIIEVLNYLGEKIGVVIDWTSDNVAPYVQNLCEKYITYELVMSILTCILGILIIGAGGIFHKLIYKNKKWGISYYRDGSYCDNFGRCMMYVGVGVVYFVGFLIMAIEITDIVKCICFPEMRVYEYITSLIERYN